MYWKEQIFQKIQSGYKEFYQGTGVFDHNVKIYLPKDADTDNFPKHAVDSIKEIPMFSDTYRVYRGIHTGNHDYGDIDWLFLRFYHKGTLYVILFASLIRDFTKGEQKEYDRICKNYKPGKISNLNYMYCNKKLKS